MLTGSDDERTDPHRALTLPTPTQGAIKLAFTGPGV